MELIRGISGIRGIVGQTLTEPILAQYIRAFAAIQGDGPILVARDTRSHGENLINAGCHALQKCGRETQNFGIIPTPTAQFLVEKNGLAGGVVITASHNPIKWNGIKFIDSDGCFLSSGKNMDLFKIADDNIVSSTKPGYIKNINSGFLPHIEHTRNLSVIDTDLIKKRKFTAVIDAVNGAASLALPAMLEALGCIVHRLYCDPDGKFPRGTEPLPHNLKNLGDAVVTHDADVGFATDPDGDRLAVVDQNGQPLGEEYTLTICADGFLSSTSSTIPIVTNLSTSMALDRIAEKYGSSVIRSAVGEINVVNQMKEAGSLFGGEGNGGIILKESHYGRDSLVGTALFLNRMALDSKPVSSIFQSMPQYVMVKNKIELGSIDSDSVIDKIANEFPNALISRIDGLKLSFEDSWAHIRKSNTEPFFRIYAEAPTKLEVDNLINKVQSFL